jgi:glycosyltransferase involved in cell wall biosynthesis
VLLLVENNPYPQDFRVRREALALQQHGCEVRVIAPRGAGQPWRETIAGVDVRRFPMPPAGTGLVGYAIEFGWSTAVMALMALWTAVRRGVDVVHAANPPDTLVFIALLLRPLGARFVFDHHDLSPEIYLARGGSNPSLIRILKFLERLSMRSAHAVISTNESYRRVAIERCAKAPEDVFVVRNGPPLSYVPMTPDPALAARARYIVGYVGTIGRQDGLDYLVKAMSHLVKMQGRADVLAVIVGDGDELPVIRALSTQLGLDDNILFTGRLDEARTRQTLSAATVCVQPDPSGQLNDHSTMNKMMEYMALGKPVVAFGLTETRFSAGEAALYARNNDTQEFAELIDRLLRDPEERERMGRVGRARVDRQLAWEHSVPNLVACYRHVLQRDFVQHPSAEIATGRIDSSVGSAIEKGVDA